MLVERQQRQVMSQAKSSDQGISSWNCYSSRSKAGQQLTCGSPIPTFDFDVWQNTEQREASVPFISAKSMEEFQLDDSTKHNPFLVQQVVDHFLESTVFASQGFNPCRSINENGACTCSRPFRPALLKGRA
jgi:hypothetical protein